MIIASLVFGLLLTGCARNNVNNDVAYRNANRGPAVVDNRDMNQTNLTDLRDRNRITDTRDDHRITGDRNYNRITTPNDNRSKMRVADDAAKKVTDLKEVDTANVIVTENNAYVAAKLKRSYSKGLSNQVENKISKAVKSVDPDIDNVYVSVNPDFYHRMTTYTNDLRNGRPVSGLFNEFTKTIRRVFPDLK